MECNEIWQSNYGIGQLNYRRKKKKERRKKLTKIIHSNSSIEECTEIWLADDGIWKLEEGKTRKRLEHDERKKSSQYNKAWMKTKAVNSHGAIDCNTMREGRYLQNVLKIDKQFIWLNNLKKIGKGKLKSQSNRPEHHNRKKKYVRRMHWKLTSNWWDWEIGRSYKEIKLKIVMV